MNETYMLEQPASLSLSQLPIPQPSDSFSPSLRFFISQMGRSCYPPPGVVVIGTGGHGGGKLSVWSHSQGLWVKLGLLAAFWSLSSQNHGGLSLTQVLGGGSPSGIGASDVLTSAGSLLPLAPPQPGPRTPCCLPICPSSSALWPPDSSVWS